MIRQTPKEPYKGLKRTPFKKRIIKSPPKPSPLKKRSRLRIRIDPLDTLTSEYVRKKSKGFCERCGKYYGWQNLQCCHFHSRRKVSVRYDEDNLAACDFGCHQYLDGNPMEKIEFFKQRIGEEKFDLLNSRVRITYPKPDKKMIEIYLRAEIKKLDSENNYSQPT